jgi:hypothetical protein
MRVFFDTGSTSTIILRTFTNQTLPCTKGIVQWTTTGGMFSTKWKAPIYFKLPEFSTKKTITWIPHVDETTSPNKAMFDLIIGLDLAEALGISISF